MLEDYEGAELELHSLIYELLSRICRGAISITAYESMVKWMKVLIVNQVFSCENNEKVAGRVIRILQCIAKKGSPLIIEMLAAFTVRSFIEHVKSPG